jgi:hypothetical protein
MISFVGKGAGRLFTQKVIMSAPAKTMVKPMTLAEAVALLDRAPVMGLGDVVDVLEAWERAAAE